MNTMTWLAQTLPGVLLFLIGIWFLFRPGRVSAPSAITLTLAGTFFLNLDRFELIKAPGWEWRVQRSVARAQATMEDLRRMSISMGAATILALQWAGNGGTFDAAPPPYAQKQRLEHDLRETLSSLGVTNDELEKALQARSPTPQAGA